MMSTKVQWAMTSYSSLSAAERHLRENNSNATLQATLEVTLATATGQHLRLQHQILRLQVSGNLLGLLARLGHTESEKGREISRWYGLDT